MKDPKKRARVAVKELADLDELADRLAPLVAARLAAYLLTIGAHQGTYTTRKEGPRPVEFKDRRRAWRDLVPGIPGAYRVGRWWSVSHGDFVAWCGAKARPAPAGPAAADEPWSPETVAGDLGLRITRKNT